MFVAFHPFFGGEMIQFDEHIVLKWVEIMAGQPTPPNVPPPEIRPDQGLINHWFPLIRPY